MEILLLFALQHCPDSTFDGKTRLFHVAGAVCGKAYAPHKGNYWDFSRILPICRTFLGDFNPQKLPSRGLRTLWEWKNRVLLEEYYIFNVAIPLEVQREQSYETQ